MKYMCLINICENEATRRDPSSSAVTKTWNGVINGKLKPPIKKKIMQNGKAEPTQTLFEKYNVKS